MSTGTKLCHSQSLASSRYAFWMPSLAHDRATQSDLCRGISSPSIASHALPGMQYCFACPPLACNDGTVAVGILIPMWGEFTPKRHCTRRQALSVALEFTCKPLSTERAASQQHYCGFLLPQQRSPVQPSQYVCNRPTCLLCLGVALGAPVVVHGYVHQLVAEQCRRPLHGVYARIQRRHDEPRSLVQLLFAEAGVDLLQGSPIIAQ